MILNICGEDGFLFQALATGFKEGHIQDRLKFEVVDVKDVGAKFREAVKKAYSAKFLDDADVVVRFAVPKAETEPDGGEDGGEPEKEGSDVPPEEKDEKNDGGAKNDAGSEEGKEKDGKEEVSEAETTATGEQLRRKIVDTIRRKFYLPDDGEVEVSDLQGYIEGHDVYFAKVALKKTKGSAEDAD